MSARAARAALDRLAAHVLRRGRADHLVRNPVRYQRVRRLRSADATAIAALRGAAREAGR